MDPITLFSIVILILSVVIHEVSHGYAALALGDRTALYAGRLTLNPIKHLDPFGSVILPLILSILPGGIIFGWAKPVPYNPYNLKNQRWGELLVAIAGPLSNILIATIFGVVIRLAGTLNLAPAFIEISLMVVVINLVLAFFNLMPIPPLDGSKVLFSVFPRRAAELRHLLERWGFFFLIFFIFFLWDLFFPLIISLTKLLTGLVL
jgi:Zn-dependent protease